jgi:hypothetical protein
MSGMNNTILLCCVLNARLTMLLTALHQYEKQTAKGTEVHYYKVSLQ